MGSRDDPSGRGDRLRLGVQPQALGVKPGVDLERLNQLVDELDADARLRSLRV